MIILYNAPRSSASRRVRLCLEEKGLRYDNRVVDMERLEHHSPEYLRINPNGVVPTMVHDGRPLHESGTICEYLDEISPDRPLRPGPRRPTTARSCATGSATSTSASTT
jgi:glutathione S-transferase